MKNVTFVKRALRSGRSFLALAALSSFHLMAETTHVSELPFLIQDLTTVNADPLACAADADDSVADCVCVNEEKKTDPESDPEPYGQRVIYKVTDWKEVPKSLREIVNLDRPGDVSEKNPLYFSILHKNDNWPSIKGLDSVGLSAVAKFEVGGVAYNNGKPLAWGGYLYSALYSQRIVRTVKPDGKMVNREWMGSWDEFAKTIPEGEVPETRAKNDQMTKNQENTVLAMFVNNFPQKKPFMWSLEGGLGVVDTNKGLVMHPLQGLWHKSLGIVKYESIADENDRIYSAYLKGSVGLQKKLFDSRNCTFSMNTSGGASFDTGGRRNFVSVDMGADMGLFSSKSGDRKILNLDSSVKYQGPLSGGPATAAMSNGVTVDMGKVKVASGVISPLVGNYTEDFKTNYSKAQKLGYIKLIFVLKRKP